MGARTRGRAWRCILWAAAMAAVAGAQSLSLSAIPSAVTIFPGEQNVAIQVSVTSGGSTGPVEVTLTGLPSGIMVTPLTLDGGGTGTLTISATLSADQENFPTNNISFSSQTSQVSVVAAAGSAQATAPLTLTVSLTNPAYAPSASQINLPIVNINTSGTPITSTTTDVPGTITITSADGQTSYLPNSSDGDNTASFHVHGNSTARMPKLPYEVKLNTSLDLLDAMGLSCPYATDSSAKPTCDKSKTYILLANYDDKTFLRDWSASALANAIPLGGPYLNSAAGSPSPSGTSELMPWAPHSLFVELYLNGVYEGNYQLIEKVNVDSHRVNITELTDTDTSDVTGGYLLEIDQEMGEDYMFTTPAGLPIGLVDPDFTPEVPQQTGYITNYVDSAETALFSSSFTDPTRGWRAYFDEASAVNFYIVNDLMGNVDGGEFFSSDYFYKDIGNPLLYMGPIWDFDISSGNTNYAAIMNPTAPWMQTQAPWYAQWFQDPGFAADVATQWNALKDNGVFTAWLASITQEAATLEQSQANNSGRWPMQGMEVWPNPEAAGNYDAEVAYLTNWIRLRLGYLDSRFNNKTPTQVALGVGSGTASANSPVTLTATVSGGSAPTGQVTFLANNVVIGAGTLGGSGNANLATVLPTGADSLQAVYNGDDNNALSTSAAQSLTVAAPLTTTVTSLGSATAAVYAGNSASFTAAVIGNSGATAPTGTLTFYSGATVLGTANLNDGLATFSTTSLPAGSVSVQAVYGGDGTYQGSTSNEMPIEVVNFTLSAAPGSATAQTIDAGETATYSLAINPGNFTGTATFSCGGIPADSTCTVNPSQVGLSGGGASVSATVTITTTARSLASSPVAPPGKEGPGWAWLLLGAALLPAILRRRCATNRLLGGLAYAAVLMAGCGAGTPATASGTPAGTYTISVTMTAGTVTQSVPFTLDVN